MNNRNGKTIINRGGAEVGKTKIAKTVNASFLGSYSYFQPGRANQYDLGTDNYNGLTDIPLYLAWMNEKNGGILYFPTNLKEKYQFYRYFYRCFIDKNILITLSDGSQKTIEELSEGDNVVNMKGNNVSIDKKIENNYTGDVYTFKCEGKKPLKVTAEHPFFILEKKNIKRKYVDKLFENKKIRKTEIKINYQPVWKKASEISVGDMFIVPNIFNNEQTDITIELSRLFGYFIAEGSYAGSNGKYRTIRFTFNKSELEILNEVEKLLKLYTNNKICYYNKKNSTTIYVNDRKLTDLFIKYIKGNALNKKISDDLLNMPLEHTKHLISCWINGDGHITKENQMEVTTTSDVLANQMYLLMVKCGYSPTRYKINRILPNHNSNMIYLSTNDSNDLNSYTLYKCNKNNDSCRYRKYNYNGNMLLPIRKIEKEKFNGTVYNISTNGKEYEERTFLVDNIITHNCDAYVGAAIDLHTDLPMSKITLKMPPMNNIKRRNIIKKKYESMCEKLKLFTKLQSILFDYWVIGNVFVFCQYDPNLKEFVKLVILPPEDVNITKYPLSDDSLIVYNQEQVIELVKRLKSLNKDYSNFDLYLNDTSAELSEVDKRILSSIPDELLKYIFDNESINFDTDPYAGGELGSFCFHLARRKHEYATLGSSILERIFVPLMQKLHYTYTQWSLASRNMTPRNKITAPEISPEQLEQLREQFDMSMLTPEYSIITNYDWNWDIVGADNRLIDLGREYEVIENQIFAGLGVTREVLTGEGMYSSGHINVEIMNARYLLIRDIFKNMVEENLFKPIAKENGFYDVDEDGFTHYYYPKLSFERLSIIDNSENFDKMFNLYQKNSLPIGYIYEMLNIDEEEATEKLRKDMFTVKDATFNEMVREVYTRVGDSIVDETNIAELMTGSLFVNGTSVTMKNSDESDENDESSDDPFSTDDSMSNSEETIETNNDVEEDNKEKLKEKEIEKHSIELNDQDFEDFIKTQELVATDDEITEFLRNQNEVMIYNKDLKDFMNEYFLKPTNKDVDTFENLIDPEFHPTNTMFENFLEKRGIVTPSNKDIKDFFKLYFLKPTNDQIRKFLDRYKYISIEDEDVNKFIEDSKNNQVNNIKESQEMDDNHIDVMTATDDDLENYLSDQVGEDVTDNIIMNSKKIKKPFQI